MQLFFEPSERDFNKDIVLQRVGVFRLHKINDIIKDAVSTVTTNYRAELFNLSKRTVASLIHDKMQELCEQQLGSVYGVRVVRKNNTFKLVLDDANITLQLKKFNRKNMTSNIHTQDALDFMRQEASLFPKSINLSAGYRMDLNNLSENFIPETIITCPNSENNNHWAENLENAISTAQMQNDTSSVSEQNDIPEQTKYKTSVKKDIAIEKKANE